MLNNVIVLLLVMFASNGTAQTSGAVAPSMEICAAAGVDISGKVETANPGSKVVWSCQVVKRDPNQPDDELEQKRFINNGKYKFLH